MSKTTQTIKRRKALNADELKALAAKTQIPEDVLRTINTRLLLSDRSEPSPEQLEDEAYLQADLDREVQTFQDVCLEYNLLNRLNGRERKRLWKTWLAANLLRFLFENPRHSESWITHHEENFMRNRNRLCKSKRWRCLELTTKADIERRLFTTADQNE